MRRRVSRFGRWWCRVQLTYSHSWPFLRDAMVVAVSDGTARYEKDADEAAVQLSQAEVLQHQRDAANDRMKMLSARAVDIGDDRVCRDLTLNLGGIVISCLVRLALKFACLLEWVVLRLDLFIRFGATLLLSFQFRFEEKCDMSYSGSLKFSGIVGCQSTPSPRSSFQDVWCTVH